MQRSGKLVPLAMAPVGSSVVSSSATGAHTSNMQAKAGSSQYPAKQWSDISTSNQPAHADALAQSNFTSISIPITKEQPAADIKSIPASGEAVAAYGSASEADNTSTDVNGDCKVKRAGAKRHLEAEQRRRNKINDRLAQLRTLVPCSERSNTATFLDDVIAYVTNIQASYNKLQIENDTLKRAAVDAQLDVAWKVSDYAHRALSEAPRPTVPNQLCSCPPEGRSPCQHPLCRQRFESTHLHVAGVPMQPPAPDPYAHPPSMDAETNLGTQRRPSSSAQSYSSQDSAGPATPSLSYNSNGNVCSNENPAEVSHNDLVRTAQFPSPVLAAARGPSHYPPTAASPPPSRVSTPPPTMLPYARPAQPAAAPRCSTPQPAPVHFQGAPHPAAVPARTGTPPLAPPFASSDQAACARPAASSTYYQLPPRAQSPSPPLSAYNHKSTSATPAPHRFPSACSPSPPHPASSLHPTAAPPALALDPRCSTPQPVPIALPPSSSVPPRAGTPPPPVYSSMAPPASVAPPTSMAPWPHSSPSAPETAPVKPSAMRWPGGPASSLGQSSVSAFRPVAGVPSPPRSEQQPAYETQASKRMKTDHMQHPGQMCGVVRAWSPHPEAPMYA